jgi:ferrous iron transport protein A
MPTDLTQLKEGERGKIVDIQGGFGLIKRLDALGIKVGEEITKISSQLMKGPIVLQVKNTQVAIGYGMAKKIIVEVKE